MSEQAIADYQEQRVRDYNMAFIEGLGMGGHDSDSELSETAGDDDDNEEMSISTQETRLTPQGGMGGRGGRGGVVGGGGGGGGGGLYQDGSVPLPHAATPPILTAPHHTIGQGQGQGQGQGVGQGQGQGQGPEKRITTPATPFSGASLLDTHVPVVDPHTVGQDSPVISPSGHVDTPMTDAGDYLH